nr:sulfatase-like hydrolase/transferase [Crateriforma conspicua]
MPTDQSAAGYRRMTGLLSIVVLVIAASRVGAATPTSPSIVLIVADDLGYNDLGCLGGQIISPNLDRLAAEGIRLTNFYVAWSACTPSRAALLTGRYPQRNGISDMIRNEAPDYGHRYTAAQYAATFERIGGMDVRESTLANYLSDAGYRCGIYGKWDLGSLRRFLPTSRGFDDFYGFVNTGIDYYTHERYGVPSMFRNESPTVDDRGTYCTDLFLREALRFLDQQPSHQPYFLYLPFNAPHNSSSLDPKIRSTIQAPERFKAMYPEVAPTYRTTDRYRYGNPATVVTTEARRRDYAAAVTCMDDAIGQVISRIESRGQLDQTIVIFLSDNGGGGGSDNTPLRGKKSTMWEGGVRVPCLVRWPDGNLKPGQVNHQLLTSLEILPSLCSAADADVPADVTLDGFDWWDTLRGDTDSPRKSMFWKRQDRCGARVGDWKWVDMPDKGQGGLYRVTDDIGESNDLSQQYPDVLEDIQAKYRQWENEMQEAPPRGPFRDF